MKRWISVFMLVCLCVVMSTPAVNGAVYVSGIKGNGSHHNEPEPQKSKYLKTYTGGFGIREKGAYYHVFIDLRKFFSKPMLVKAEFMDPLNQDKPSVQHGQILRGSQSLTLSDGPVRGLQIHGDYWVKISIYDPDKTDEPVDQLTQKIRSYIDTTTEIVYFFDELQRDR